MKTLLPFYAFAVAVMVSCSGQDKGQPAESSSGDASTAEAAPQQGADKSMIDDFRSDPFHLENAARIGSYLLNLDEDLKNLAIQTSFGGTFDASVFRFDAASNANAVRLWYCYNPDDPGFPKFFLAAEQVQYDFDNEHGNPEDHSIMQPNLKVPQVFTYTGARMGKIHVEQLMRQHRTSNITMKDIPKDKVLEYAANFKVWISDISPADLQYCKYAASIFEKNNTYDEFMGRNLVWVRYYLGLAIDDLHEPNYLRPVLAGVKADGSTLSDSGNPTVGAFLQKSVPPPPIL